MPSPPLPLVQSLSPRIAVLTSDDVVQSCEANGCRGLEELLRPWEGGTERVSILSSTLIPGVHPTFPLRFVSFASVFPHPAVAAPNPDMVVDRIGSLVGARRPDEEQHYPLTRSLLLSSRTVASHETFNHPVCTLLAVSTSEPDALGALQRLQARAIGPMAMATPWMDGVNVMRFFVVVHDVSKMGEDLAPAHELLASVKKGYGPHSTLLVINSQVEHRPAPPSPDITTHPTIPLARPLTPLEASDPSALSQVYASALSSLTLSPLASLSDPPTSDAPMSPSKPARRKLYGAKLNGDDTQRLAALVRELVVQSLVPWMEARVREWNEVYHANRRGITGRLFGAGRKFFGSRPASPAPNSLNAGYNTAKGYYPITAIEGLSRRLADFAFMLRDYKYAATVYDSLRRDFAQDRAWRYAAAATEMYGLSLLLSHPYFLPSTPPRPTTSSPTANPFTTMQHTDIALWLEQAVVAYTSRVSPSAIQLDAMRITVLYYEAWKMVGEWRGVGAALVRAAGEADEVPSAVLIEEAAGADVRGGKSERGKRRRAFHLVMAARRYETAGLKTYSRRCLDRASATYRAAPWTAAQDRIEYSLGRQAYTLGESDLAVEHFLRLLRREDTGVGGSQGMVLEDMALAYEQLKAHPDMLSSAEGRLHLPTPVFDVGATRIVAGPSASTSGTTERWADLEAEALGKWDRKGKKPMSLLPDPKRILASVDEAFQVDLIATNPLNAPLVLEDLSLQVESPSPLVIETVPSITLDPYESRVISINVTSACSQTINITHATFLFHRFFPVTQPLAKRGKRLFATKAHKLNPVYAEDRSLCVSVVEAGARIRVELDGEWPGEVYAGEEVRVGVRAVNCGKASVEALEVVMSEGGVLRLHQDDTQHGDTTAPVSVSNKITRNTAFTLYPGMLQPGEAVTIPLILTGVRAGPIELLALAVCSSVDSPDDIATATFSHTMHVQPLASISAQARFAKPSPRDYVVGVQVVNESAEEVCIDAINAIGPSWTSGPSRAAVPAAVLPNQSFRTFVDVSLAPHESLDLSQGDVVADLTKLVQNQPDSIVPSDLPPVALPELPSSATQSYLASLSLHRFDHLRRSFPTVAPDLLPSIFPLFDPLALDVQISWSIPSTARRGYATLHGVPIAPSFSVVEGLRRDVDKALAEGGKQTRTMYEETGRLRRVLMDSVLEGELGREDDPLEVRTRAKGDGVVVHDFSLGACTVPVHLQLRNRSPLLPVRYILRLRDGPASNEDNASSLAMPHFLGTLAHQGTIQPGQETVVDSAVWVVEPSLVSLGEWELEVETGEEEGAEWRARYSWYRRGRGGMIEVRQGQVA